MVNVFLAVVLCFGMYLKICSVVDKKDCKKAVKQIEEIQKNGNKERVKEKIS